MTTTDLRKILDAHREWSVGNGGERANLRSAYLRSANLRSADLRSADLSGADLSGADLRSAYLRSADLRSANLRSADLRSADLSGADLRSAYLSGANLNDKTTWPAFFICPETGSFRAWKKLKGGIIAELEIPAKAKRVCTPIGRKCRAEFVKVIAVHGTMEAEGVDTHAGKTKYIVGKITHPDSFDDNFLVECTHGIHFLMTRKEAEEYA
jgi:uncharacterized protein YjbI with pentapeptide repeats